VPEEKKEIKKVKKKRTLFQKIVNVFLYVGLGIFIILLLVFGFSQTSTFREMLRDTVIEEANSALNGTLDIEKIEGTIFTSLILRNTVVNIEEDTILTADKIEVRTSPLQLLFKKIYARKIEIENADISLQRNEEGILNIERLLPETEEDTTTSDFPFTIEAAELNLVDVNFRMQSFKNSGSTEVYDTLNSDDLRLNNLNLSLSASADISENKYRVIIDNFFVTPNINNIELKELTGEIRANQSELIINDLRIRTSESNIFLDARLTEFNVFDSTSHINDARVFLDFSSENFQFNDLSAFIPAINMLQGAAEINLRAAGSFQRLDYDLLEVKYRNTNLSAAGNVLNLDDPDNMYITANFSDSYIDQNDINILMPSLEIPTYPDYGVIRFNELFYEGKPLNFKTKLAVVTDRGRFTADGSLNFEKELMEYNLKFSTNSLDISPFAGLATNLNSSGSIVGVGTEPERMNAEINLVADGSTVDDIRIDTLRFMGAAKNKLVDFDLILAGDTLGAYLAGDIDFTNDNNPEYSFAGSIKNLNLYDFVKDSSLVSSLNFNIDAEGENFDPNRMNLFVSLLITESSLRDVEIDSSRAIVDLRRDIDGERVINIISDLADITIQGNFSIPQTISLLSSEAQLLSNVAQEKINELFPEYSTDAELQQKVVNGKVEISEPLFESSDSTTTISYNIELKDFSLISAFMGENQLEIDGEMFGEIRSTQDSVYFSYNADLQYVKYWGKNDVFFLSNMNLNLAIANSYEATSLENIFADVDLTTERVFAGSDIYDINLGLHLEDKAAAIKFSARMEDYLAAGIDGTVDLSGSTLVLNLDSLGFDYQQFRLVNNKPVVIEYSQDKIDIKNFNLSRDSSEILIAGSLVRDGNQDLSIDVRNFSGRDLSVNLLDIRPQNSLDAEINLSVLIKGDFKNPIIAGELNIDSVTFQNRNFGSLIGNFDYENQDLVTDIRFLNRDKSESEPALIIAGNIPMDISFEGTDEAALEDRQMDIKLTASNFDLGTFGDVLPAVNRLRGILSANLEVKGAFDNPQPSGQISITDAAFIVEATNMEYYTGLKINFADNLLSIDSLLIQNREGTEGGGKMTAAGKAKLDGLNIVSSDIAVSGALKVLSEGSRSASPSVFGDLVISTDGAIEFTMDEDGAKLKAPIIVRTAELTFPPTQSAYQTTQANFVYRYVKSDSDTLEDETDFESLVELANKQNAGNLTNNKQEISNFDYSINVEVEDEATIIFVLSREFNQNLTAVLSGNFLYENIGGKTNAQGELKLLEGSTLEFIKTLEAEGSIRFESDLSNPYLDITATYSSYYYPAENAATTSGAGGTGDEVLVAVKIKLRGFLKELDKNFIQDEDNIAVYYGAENIENDQPDRTKDASDAVMFMVLGKFNDNATQQDRNYLESQTAALAGSLLGGLLHRQFGSYISSVEVRQSGSQTRFSLVGRAGDFRYTIGGTTEVFRQLENANVKIEYPLVRNLLIRLERREDITEATTQTEMINELGLKYRFEF
jgi:hypothetical protein